MKHRFSLCLLFVAWGGMVHAASGDVRPWQQYLDALGEEEDFEKISWTTYEDVLTEYAEQPLNINQATREDLQRLPFLTSQQIEDIQAYLERYGSMKSLGELAMIPSISWQQRQLLTYFVVAGEVEHRGFPSLKNIAKYGKQEFVAMAKIPFYERKGDQEGYLGYKYKHWMRYQFRYGDYVKLGFLASQDAGEPFFSGTNAKGYDFYSFYLQIRKWERIKNLTIGRYRLHEGMGLILNNDLSLGKSGILTSLGRNSNAIRVHSSRSEANYLQGMAATIHVLSHLDLTGFVSYRSLDATLKDGGIRTIVTSGLHRTQKEIEKRNVATTFLIGGNLNYVNQGFHIGATALSTSYSKPLTPDNQQLYKRFAPQGNRFWNASVDYGYISHRWLLQGETATGDCGVVATVNTISYLFSERFSLMGLYRFYPYRYYALYANSFGESSDVQDEHGAYLGMRWSPAAKWDVSAYTDFAYFVWPKYGTDGSTYSTDMQLQVTFRPSDKLTFLGRYRYKDKQGTVSQRARISCSFVNQTWNLRTQCDVSLSQDEERSRGWMLSQIVGFQHAWLRLHANLGYFHTDDYSSRVYGYEAGLLYTMSQGSYFGQGLRYAVVARAGINKHLILIGKLGVTDYFDRNHISSGLQQINKSSQSDLEMQIKWKW